MSRRAHHPHTARGHRPLLEAMQRLPLRARCTTSKTGRTIKVDEYHDPGEPRTKPGGPKTKPATSTGTCGRPSNGPSPGSPAGKPDVFPTEESHRNQQLAHHQNRSHQPTTPHQPRTRPHHHRLGHQPRLEPQKTGTPPPKNPTTATTDPKHPPQTPNRPHHTQHHHPTHQHSQPTDPIIGTLLGVGFWLEADVT